MYEVYEKIKAIEEGRPISVPKCPKCGKTLKILLFGLPSEKTFEFIKKNKEYFTLGGCVCFGDDRDPMYICPECKDEFTHDLKQIKLITCPLEASGMIFENECRDYDLLERRYHEHLLNERELICNKICLLMKKKVRVKTKDASVFEGELLRTHLTSVSTSKSHITLVNTTEEYNHDYIDIIISEFIKKVYLTSKE